jgi:hypothetical protein
MGKKNKKRKKDKKDKKNFVLDLESLGLDLGKEEEPETRFGELLADDWHASGAYIRFDD